jgi:hypothetical protein
LEVIAMEDADFMIFRGAGVSSQAAAATLNVFTDGMALKAVILGSLALAFLA